MGPLPWATHATTDVLLKGLQLAPDMETAGCLQFLLRAFTSSVQHCREASLGILCDLCSISLLHTEAKARRKKRREYRRQHVGLPHPDSVSDSV